MIPTVRSFRAIAIKSPAVLPPSLNPYMMSPGSYMQQVVANRNLFECCAAPKKRTSLTRRRKRRAGQRAVRAKQAYVNYGICTNCGRPVRPHFLCHFCQKVTHVI